MTKEDKWNHKWQNMNSPLKQHYHR